MADENESDKAKRALRMRNVALGLGLGFLVVLFYAMTMVRLGEQ